MPDDQGRAGGWSAPALDPETGKNLVQEKVEKTRPVQTGGKKKKTTSATKGGVLRAPTAEAAQTEKH